MKLRYIITGLICGLAWMNTSCGLDYEPIDTYSDVTQGIDKKGEGAVFKDKAAVITHMQGIYKEMRERQETWYVDLLLISDAHSDNAYGGTTGPEALPFENNSIDASSTIMSRDWKWYLADVGMANKLIVNIEEVQDKTLTTAERKQYKAEAQIFRALIYFDMVRIWGIVPIITTVAPDITSENIKEVYPLYFPKQGTEDEVYKQIEKDLLEAIVSAPDNNPSNKTLFTKSVARALLAKVYAEKPLRDYNKVIKYVDELASDGFDLVADYSDLFGMNEQVTDAKARNTKESILEAQFFPGAGNWCTWMFGRDLVNWDSNFTWAKWITPSRNLIRAYENEGDKKRMGESIVYYKATWSNYYPSDNYPFMYKCRSANSSIIKMRYADLLLLKAEALIMKDGADLAGAATIIDRVRQRVSLDKLDSSVKGSKDLMLEALLKERRLELAFEGQRWFDLVRLDKVESVMNSVFAKDSGRFPQKNQFNNHSYRLPIPQTMIDENPNLVQNLGY